MNKKVVDNIKCNYSNLEEAIVKQLNLKVDNHYLTAGHNREKIWLNLFRQIVPMKFAIKQGVFLIDSKGKVSKEIDIAIFDEQFTPYIFKYENIHYIPIEAVAVVIQCKSKYIDNKEVNKWYKEVDILETSTGGLARMVSFIAIDSPDTQKSTKPLSVLCHMYDDIKYENDNYDLVITAKEDNKLGIKWNNKVDTLEKAFLKLNGIEKLEDIKCYKNEDQRIKEIKPVLNKKLDSLSVPDNSILSLIFQLNQLLMLINNPMLFPHQAYVEMFNKTDVS